MPKLLTRPLKKHLTSQTQIVDEELDSFKPIETLS